MADRQDKVTEAPDESLELAGGNSDAGGRTVLLSAEEALELQNRVEEYSRRLRAVPSTARTLSELPARIRGLQVRLTQAVDHSLLTASDAEVLQGQLETLADELEQTELTRQAHVHISEVLDRLDRQIGAREGYETTLF